MFNSIGDILELITRKDWESFRSNVLSSPAVFRNLAGAVEACSALNGMTLLHAIVRCSPPLDIVAQMVAICPYMPSTKDCLRRTPLHVAAGSNASASLIELLARANPAACDVQDGRYSLTLCMWQFMRAIWRGCLQRRHSPTTTESWGYSGLAVVLLPCGNPERRRKHDTTWSRYKE